MAFEDLAVFPINGFPVGIEFRHVGAVDFGCDIPDAVLQAMRKDGATKDIKLVAQGIGNGYQICLLACLGILFVFLSHDLMPQTPFRFRDGGGGISLWQVKMLVELRYQLD